SLALFGVRMEDLAPARGLIVARGAIDIRAKRGALVELGWSDERGFHELRPGDELSGGHALATLKADDSTRLAVLEGLLRSPDFGPDAALELAGARTESISVTAPDSSERWLVTQVPVATGQLVRPGDRIATLVPLDPATHKPRDLLVRMEFD